MAHKAHEKSPKSDAYRAPTELFGRGAEMDAALEKKLLNNLKKHSPKILQPIDTSTISKLDSTQISSFPHNPVLSARSREAMANAANTTISSTSTVDGNLLTSLTQRLSKVEEQSIVQQRELFAKDNTLQQQAKRLEDYELQIAQLKHERDQSKQTILEMEAFLNDYGLVWVGGQHGGGSLNDHHEHGDDSELDYEPQNLASAHHDILPPIKHADSSPSNNANHTSNNKKNKNPERSGFKLDINRIMHSISELNALAGEHTSNYEHSHHGKSKIRQLKEQQSVPVTFYRNGFKLFSGPFRSFNTPESQQFINDLYDGYFPYELKDRFPNGVSLKVTDMSYKDYDHKNDSKSSPNNIRGMASLEERTQTTQQFLQKLPASTIKNGRVVDVRGSIANMTQGANSNNTQHNHTTHTLVRDPSNGKLARSGSAKDNSLSKNALTKIKIKTETGDTLLVQLKLSDTIKTLRDLIDKHNGKVTQYEIRSAFPKKIYSDPLATLEDAGLFPACTIFIKRL